MLKPVQHPQTLQMLEFAEFKVDLRTRELRRNGDRVHLQDQPFSVLVVLLEHAGEVVTREQLRQHLWSSDTFVDFDNSLNTAIDKIREALADSAEDPRFVETLPRRGYRFIAPLNGGDASSRETRQRSRFHLPVAVLAAGLVVTAGIAVVAVWQRSPTSSPRIVGSKQLTNDGVLKVAGMVTDGARIYFSEVLGGRNVLMQTPTAGGEAAILKTSAPDPVILAISPDHSQLLVACSPDGSKLRFTVFDLDKDEFSIWEVASDGNSMHPLLSRRNDPPRDCCGRWTPDGRYYVFQGEQGSVFNIWAIRERNGLFARAPIKAMQVTGGPLSFAAPVSSKDGKQLFVIGHHERAEIIEYDTRSGSFVPFLGGIAAFGVEFSRDGKWMTYSDSDALIWRVKLDGSEAMQLTFPPMRADPPLVSGRATNCICGVRSGQGLQAVADFSRGRDSRGN